MTTIVPNRPNRRFRNRPRRQFREIETKAQVAKRWGSKALHDLMLVGAAGAFISIAAIAASHEPESHRQDHWKPHDYARVTRCTTTYENAPEANPHVQIIDNPFAKHTN